MMPQARTDVTLAGFGGLGGFELLGGSITLQHNRNVARDNSRPKPAVAYRSEVNMQRGGKKVGFDVTLSGRQRTEHSCS